MKTLILVCGLPGSGKTTLANKLIVNVHCQAEITADDYPNLYIDGVYQAELQKRSHEWCKKLLRIG